MLPSLGTLKTVGSGLGNLGRGALFMGASKGSGIGGKALNALGHAAPLTPAVAGSFKATSQQPGFKPQSTVKTSGEDSPSEKKPSLLGAVAEGAGYGALAGTPLGFLQGSRTAKDSHKFMSARTNAAEADSFHHGALLAAQQFDPNGPLMRSFDAADALQNQYHPNHAEDSQKARTRGPYPGRVVADTLAPVLGGAVLGGLTGGAKHLWDAHKKSASLADVNPIILQVLRAKLASGDPAWHRPVNVLAYGAFMAPYLSQRIHDNKPLNTALNIAGLTGLAATAGDKIHRGENLSMYDLGATGLWGAGMLHEHLRDQAHPQAAAH